MLSYVNKSSISTKMKGLKPFTLNFGQEHPTAYSVLFLILMLLCQLIISVYPYIRLSYRVSEKLMEYKNYLQIYFIYIVWIMYLLCVNYFLCISIEKVSRLKNFFVCTIYSCYVCRNYSYFKLFYCISCL